MLNTEAAFRDEFFTQNPQITEAKKNLVCKYSEGYLIGYTIEKRFLFTKRKLSTFKPGVCVFYLKWDRETLITQRDLRVEEWIELTKDDLRPHRIASIKNTVLEGETIQFVWE